MSMAIKRIMLVTRNVSFAIDVKRALEALGEYNVTAVADVRNAIEGLRDHPQHLLLLDTANLSISPEIMIEMVRSRRERLAIVLAPDSPDTRELARLYRLGGVVDIPVMARSLMPILDAALQESADALTETQETPTVDVGEDTIYIESLVDDLVEEELALNYTRRRLQASYELLHPRSANEAEPGAKPALEVLVEPDEEGETVRYQFVRDDDALASTTTQLANAEIDETPIAASGANDTVRDLANSIAGDRPAEPAAVSPQDATEDANLEDSAAFEDMLGALLDESTALENLTLESLFDTTRELPGALGTGVVPAWLRETEKFIDEPSFLAEMAEALPPLTEPEGLGETTSPAAFNEPADEDAATEPAPASAEETDVAAGRPEAHAASEPWRRPISSRNEDPALAQLAVTMTQMMTDLTADATVLTRGDQIVAFSGELSLDEFRALRRVVGDDWTAESSVSRIRFITPPAAGRDYMLYSRGSVADYTLTLIFSGGRQLREIRRQGDRMLRALDSAPAEERPEEAAPPEAIQSRQPFAFVWMVNDPTRLLGKQVAEQLVFWLEVQLNSLNWKIKRLDVHHDFIYLSADVPGRVSPDALVRTVMDRARAIACSEDKALPQALWADAYLVLQPGRDMSERELQRFLHFARA
ncbi:MAG: hypothetical protein OXI34_01140 [Chloroflexota bacterium]|nr:hypothetical protein [Chloroflexota bacterium]MDE2947313.1 hypothetical protein [Chloroflexota bacterium]